MTAIKDTWFTHPTLSEGLRGLPTATAQKGTIFCTQGEMTRDVFVVLSGELRVIFYALSGKITQMDRLMGPCSFGEFSAIDGQGRSATVEAMTEVKYKIISGHNFLKIISENIEVQGLVLTHLLEKFRNLNQKMIETTSATLVQRIALDLLHRKNLSGKTEIEIPTQELWAQEFNVQRETLARSLAEIEETGAVIRSGRKIHILDNEKIMSVIENNYAHKSPTSKQWSKS